MCVREDMDVERNQAGNGQNISVQTKRERVCTGGIEKTEREREMKKRMAQSWLTSTRYMATCPIDRMHE